MTLFEENVDLARRMAAKFAGQGIEFDDLHQEALIALHKASERWDRRSTFSTFAYGVMKNRLIDLLQALRSRPISVMEVTDEMLMTTTLHDQFVLREDTLAALSAVAKLSEPDLKVMRSFLRGDSAEETARELGTTRGMVRWRIWNARRQLREAA